MSGKPLASDNPQTRELRSPTGGDVRALFTPLPKYFVERYSPPQD